jgi:hypothetical protein
LAVILVVGLAAVAPAASCAGGSPDVGPGQGGALESEPGLGGTSPIEWACPDGATRSCEVAAGEHAGVDSCFTGVEVCSRGQWGPCQDPQSVAVAPAPGAEPADGEALPEPRSLSTPVPCGNSPCDPSCQIFNETPSLPITGAPGGGAGNWQQGSAGELPAGLEGKAFDEPCATGADCQFNSYCEYPVSGTCSHSKCAEGSALVSSCDPCVTAVCATTGLSDCCLLPASCTQRYGTGATAAPSYESCSDTASACEFRMNAKDKTCASVCEANQGVCLDAWDPSNNCGQGEQRGCSYHTHEHNHTIVCKCDHPGGVGGWEQACVDAVYSQCGSFCPADATVCAHDKCEIGAPLVSTCDPCVQQICATDANCCSTSWDAVCVGKVASVCSQTCTPLACDTAYDAAPSYLGCVQSATECWFKFDNTSQSCTDTCADGGGSCIGAFGVSGTCGVDTAVNYGCDAVGNSSAICKCNRLAHLPLPEEGQCVPWLPGQKDPGCVGYDLTVGVPCVNTIPICNVGTTTAPSGITIVHFPEGSNQYPLPSPNLSTAGMVTCTTSATIPAGSCISVTNCTGLSGAREIMVNPPGAGHLTECNGNAGATQNNWAIYNPGTCGKPSCAGSSSQATFKPVTMFVMFDKSGSMSTNHMWTPAMAALKAFFSDPGSAELGVALRFYPDDVPTSGCSANTCSVNACANPLVPYGKLTAASAPTDTQEQALISAIDNKSPNGTTPLQLALQGAVQWAATRHATYANEQQTVVLVTDGAPNECWNNKTSEIIAIAAGALASAGTLTYAIGLDGANMVLMNGIAAAGGTGQAFFISNNTTVQDQLLTTMKKIMGNSVGCVFHLPNQGNFDPNGASVSYTSGNNAPVPLTQVLNSSQCATGDWYYNSNTNPTQLVLCPTKCATVKADATARINVSIACLNAYSSAVTEVHYLGSCPSGQTVQWGYLTYDTTTPGDGTVVFDGRVAPSEAQLGGSYTHLNTATLAAQDCAIVGPTPCPVDLFTAFGGIPAARYAALELRISINPTSNGAFSPLVNAWKVTYSCVDSR